MLKFCVIKRCNSFNIPSIFLWPMTEFSFFQASVPLCIYWSSHPLVSITNIRNGHSWVSKDFRWWKFLSTKNMLFFQEWWAKSKIASSLLLLLQSKSRCFWNSEFVSNTFFFLQCTGHEDLEESQRNCCNPKGRNQINGKGFCFSQLSDFERWMKEAEKMKASNRVKRNHVYYQLGKL